MFRVEVISGEHYNTVERWEFRFKREALEKYKEVCSVKHDGIVVAYEWHYII